MFKTDKVYIDSQIEALKLRVEWLENELKYQAERIDSQTATIENLLASIKGIRHTAYNPIS